MDSSLTSSEVPEELELQLLTFRALAAMSFFLPWVFQIGGKMPKNPKNTLELRSLALKKFTMF